MAPNFPMTQGKIPYDPMTMSLLCGILLMSLNDDVISGMHSPLPRDAMAERAMVVDTV
jgi:hypothetical protein